MATTTFYGLGGYDPEKPNNNIIRVEETPDTDTPAPTAEDKLEALRSALNNLGGTATVAGLVKALRSALDA